MYCIDSHRSLRQVHGLENEAHHARHLNDFTGHKAQFLVVIQHRVHALDPQRVNWSVEDDPLSVRRVRGGEFSEGVSGDTVSPL